MKTQLTKKQYDEFLKYFNNQVPNPNHYPIQFEYYVQMFLNSIEFKK